MKLVFEEGKVPGYTLAADGSTPPRMIVTFYYSNGITYATCLTVEELGLKVEEEPVASMPMEELSLGDASIKKPAGFLSEDGVLSIVAMALDKKEVVR